MCLGHLAGSEWSKRTQIASRPPGSRSGPLCALPHSRTRLRRTSSESPEGQNGTQCWWYQDTNLGSLIHLAHVLSAYYAPGTRHW